MKLTLILIAATFLQVSAKTYAQQVTLKVRKAPLKEVFQKIQAQTNYDFLYNADDLKSAKAVSLDFKNTALKQALDACFNNQELTYVIENTTILITKKQPAVLEKFIDKVVTGKVTDDNNLPLPGIGVKEKGTQNIVVTDINGNFKITVTNEKAILVFTSIGFNTQEITVGNNAQLSVILKEKTQALNDVVVIGYGNRKRGDVNGAISSVTAKDIESLPQISIDQMLQGKAAGVTVTNGTGAPGSSASVHIRGITSLSGSNEPLYVIDGVFIDGDANNTGTSGQRAAVNINNGENTVSPLSLINPNDIATVDILKDASATAIYGSRGANGVIIITTKKGKKGTAHLNYDGYYGVQSQGHFLKMMNLQQYAAEQNLIADVSGVGRRGEFADPSLLGPGTDWQRVVFRNAPIQSHNVSVNGGSDNVSYYISGGFLKQDGTILGSNFKRYSLRSNVDAQVKPWFKLGSSLTLNRTDENIGLSDNGGIVYSALLSAPDQAVYNPDGSYAGPSQSYGGANNPVLTALQNTNNLVRNSVNGNFYGDFHLLKDLTFRSEISGYYNFSKSKYFNPTTIFGSDGVLYGNPTASLNENWQEGLGFSWRDYFSYYHTFGKKSVLNATAGYEVSENNWNGISGYRQTFFSNDLQTFNLGDAKSARNDEYKGSNVLQSYYARAEFTYDNRYSITSTIRSDESSNFAPGHRTGYFPSVALGWTISNEAFMADFKNKVDNVKLRIGYGAVGNQNIPGYRYGAALVPTITGLGTGFNVDKYQNPTLTWQTALQTDIGLDFSLFNSRINATIDWYNKTSKNFLFQEPLPLYLIGDAGYLGGRSSPYINGGKVTNKGIEFTINSKNIVSNNFNWNSTVTFTHYTNKVVELATGNVPITESITSGFLSIPITQTVVGGPVGEFYGYQVKGIFKTPEQLRSAPIQFEQPVAYGPGGTWLGDIQYVDRDHNGVINAKDQGPIGDPNPTFTYSITNNFSYKAFDLSIFVNGSYGGKILNYLNYSLEGLNSLYTNQLAEAANYWTPSNPNSNIPEPKAGVNANLNNSTRFLQSASYLRLQNVRIGYTLPAKWTEYVKLARLKVYASAQNILVITGYKGLDPEVGEQNQNVFRTNVDIGRYPSPRVINFGINAEF